MKKVLIIATVVKTHINAFHLPYIKWLSENGYEVDVCASNDYEDPNDCVIPFSNKFFDLPFSRSPFSFNNIKTYRELKKIISNNNYDIIYCHTPVGGALGRFASRNSKSKVIYTAHGYHFWRKGSILNWLLYFPVEKILARYTDDLILINKEDYNLATRMRMAKKIHYIPGVGIDTERFKKDTNKDASSQIKNSIIYIGELSVRKNQIFLLDVIKVLRKDLPDVKLRLVGNGDLYQTLQKKIIDYDLTNNVELLGFRKDIPDLINESDIVVSSSLREGLPVNVMESMACSKSLVVSRCRGNEDLVIDGINGFVVDLNVENFSDSIMKILKDEKMKLRFQNKSYELSKQFDINQILPLYVEIFES